MEQAAPQEASTAVGDGYVGAVSARQLKEVGSPGAEEPKVIVAPSSAAAGAQQLKTLDTEGSEQVKDASLR